MKNWISFLALSALLLAFANCEDNDPPIPQVPAISACLEQKIQEYKDASACGIDSARIIRYYTQIGYVYYFSYEDCCCDYASPFFDNDCNEVCFLGGIAGIQKCLYNGQELVLENPVIIWEK